MQVSSLNVAPPSQETSLMTVTHPPIASSDTVFWVPAMVQIAVTMFMSESLVQVAVAISPAASEVALRAEQLAGTGLVSMSWQPTRSASPSLVILTV